LYGESDFISERCFGDWVDEETKPIYDLHDAFKYDFSTVTYQQMADAGETFLDLWYENMAECKMEKIGDDIKHWCLDEEDTCFRMGGVWTRVWDDFFPLIHNIVDMFEVVKTNDICYNDEELIGEWA